MLRFLLDLATFTKKWAIKNKTSFFSRRVEIRPMHLFLSMREHFYLVARRIPPLRYDAVLKC